ncbi:hypothetical protein J7J63_05860 [Candidatus Bipolaricaulota bacterium]|nr:hypothetical protein [Candidatus Bipolaricaulota bacterium]
MREALVAVYDTGILNAGGHGGVNLPIDISDVNTLQPKIDQLVSDNTAMMNVMGWMSYSTAPYQHVKSQIPFFMSEEMQVYGKSPYLNLVTTDNSIEDGSIRFSDWLDGMGAEINYDRSNSLIKLEYLTNGAVVSTLALHEDGHITANDISPTDDTHLLTYGAYKRLKPLTVTADVVSAISKAECVNAMNIAGYPFDADIDFKLIATDGSSITDVTYLCNGDTDESGVLYKFLCSQKIEVV